MKTLVAAGLSILTLLTPAMAHAQVSLSPEQQAAKDKIWPLEQSIYAGRARGDMSNYLNSTSKDYVSWPPMVAAPINYSAFKASAAGTHRGSNEKLAMEFADIALHDNTAVIYYRTHLTQKADGAPADEHYEVTHTWVRDGDQWHVLGGMARLLPIR